MADTLTWINDDSKPHSVTSGGSNEEPDGKFDSGRIMVPGAFFEYQFTEAGTYPYFSFYCVQTKLEHSQWVS